jgi:hypothetical protein
MFLRAMNKIATTFQPFARPEDVGFASATLNGVIFALPGLAPAMRELMGAIDLSKAAEGKKDEMWTDAVRCAELDEATEVGRLWKALEPDSDFSQMVEVVEAELREELTKSRLSTITVSSELTQLCSTEGAASACTAVHHLVERRGMKM